ncbi:vitelline envelope sperm lysin receptor-like isoform X1 [Haliotis rufescens]|uniref:vitelline envelope sperm lysin receptor-like isoform X1 n=2 Tax=Haliotis rufescens TaxID=6454 RepID=UPI00201E7F64|nr:vitelline envelope sperm lysin receptor-like isoform X1 [Haliotis rufescens]
MCRCAVVIVLTVFVTMPKAAIPRGYIVQVTPSCGSDGISDALVTVITDLQAEAWGKCSGATSVPFTSSDGVHFTLPVSYPQGSSLCKFNELGNSTKGYTMKVIVSYGESSNPLHQVEEEYRVTCTFGSSGQSGSKQHRIGDSLIAPSVLKNNVGPGSKAKVNLVVSSVTGGDLSATPLKLGRIVTLAATATTSGSEVGVRPTSCDAISGQRRYAILRAGCGDGIVFNTTDGFVTKGLTTRSPYFQTFAMGGDRSMNFECNFTLCSNNCDGSSCINGRKRRYLLVESNKEDNLFELMAQSIPMTRPSVGKEPQHHPKDVRKDTVRRSLLSKR